jgi:SAM-dependent methyltransferase
VTVESWWGGYVADAWARFERGEIAAETARLVRPHFRDAPRDVLDVGSGPGQLLAQIRRDYPHATLTGLDADADHVALAAEDLAERGVRADLLVASGVELPFVDEQFDLVVCQMVMPYSPDDRAFVAELARVLRPGGVLWFATHGFGFYAVRIARRGLRDKLRYTASFLGGVASVAVGWKPNGWVLVNDTPVTGAWIARTLRELGLELSALEERGHFAGLPEFWHASAKKPVRPRPG